MALQSPIAPFVGEVLTPLSLWLRAFAVEWGGATGYQFVQCRGLFVLETAIGKIAVLPMGMAQVSSIAFVKPGTTELIRLSEKERKSLSYDKQVKLINERTHQEVVRRTVKKGDMVSSFLFGGSDIVVVFQRQSNVNITASTSVHYPVRSQYAYANIGSLLRY